jgi:hypothetical protein
VYENDQSLLAVPELDDRARMLAGPFTPAQQLARRSAGEHLPARRGAGDLARHLDQHITTDQDLGPDSRARRKLVCIHGTDDTARD